MASQAQPRPSDKWIPWYIVLFFVFQSFVFGGFAYVAQKTHTGLVTDEAYKKGLAYNRVIEKARAQEELGLESDIRIAADGLLRFTLRDSEGRDVAPSHVSVWFFRPTQASADVHAAMQPAPEGGYKILPQLPAKGLWEVRIHADTAAGPYQTSKRMVIE